MSDPNPRLFIERADIGSELESLGTEDNAVIPVNLDKLPAGVVSGTTLIDFSAAPSPVVRAGVSLAMLFASRVATATTRADETPDEWLAAYTSNLGQLGFSVAGTAVVRSKFRKSGLRVHQAIIAAREKESGISIHYVDELYDNGDIIMQVRCQINPADNAETLAQKIHLLEHQHFATVIEQEILKAKNPLKESNPGDL